jgi:hypothetical protein
MNYQKNPGCDKYESWIVKIMKNPQDIDQLVKLLKKLQRLHEQELARIEPIIRQAMALGIQDLDYLERITNPLYDIVLSSGIGRELYDEYLT